MSESPKTVSHRPPVRAHDCFIAHFCNQLIKAGSSQSIPDLRRMAEERWKVERPTSTLSLPVVQFF